MEKKSLKKTLIKLININKSFTNKQIIYNLNLNINDGEFITLLGPSGSGKTTIIRLIAGLEKVDSGFIFLNEKEITQHPAEKRQINTVFQNYALFPHMSVFDNIAFGLRMQKKSYKDILKKVENILDIVQLKKFINRKPHELSGGQQQRVAIARAVINKPRLLLLDEPLSALDYRLRKKMQNELKALQRKLGITFILVTHNQEEALSISDRIILLRNGIIEQDGSPREIYEEPKNLFVANFIGDINIFDALILKKFNSNQVLANLEGYICKIKVPFYITVGEKIHVLLRPEDLRIKEINNETNLNTGLIGYIKEKNYKGMTLESILKLNNGKIIVVSEFFNENDPYVDHSLNQKMLINWVETWEVVLPYEKGNGIF
ncbi:spermidine/putrescine ABC transporter ATP-binding protein PotA [Enterobacteriaceae endosymbiont of Donacia bicoloricornis]|uniref:spermidine/putrescine ABC transporter ATP-binding protein PotA n=1 Tax=Enterobacteriaceae endosymbiont of Donacia bicoloricornis TaxID=2675772 RepID=UPI00144A0C42|nr:spermidine/putrescine ABC transporter ATP-binding protein PotA [Enterobacteriaceae endosymbiont of Donacia bicoloricornis]QJC37919.1 spermidine/putrescine ABC transporter ATP-binding protein PotA [Enterobacteriaceae endosymbiont of Donacia bicoloricornis]